MKKLIFFGLVVFFTGCNTNLNLIKNSQPKWLDNPNIGVGNKLAGVGCSKPHVRGEAYQKQLAFNRAVTMIAAQKQTTVSSVSLTKKTRFNSSYSSSYQRTSMQSVDDIKASTYIKDTYKKPNGEICVWVVER